MFGWGSKSGHITEADLSAYADGMVAPSLASRIETHIGACSECATALQELQATKTILSSLPRPATQRSFTLGPEFASQRLAAPPRTVPMRGVLSFAPALTLSILVVLLVIDLLPGGSGKSGGAVTSYGASGNAKSAAAAGPPSSPQVLSAPAAVAPQAPVPAPATGAGSAAPTPRVFADVVGPSPTPGPLSAGAVRAPNTPGTEAFNPAANPPQPTPLVSRPPLQSTSASAKDSGISLLRILEIVAAVCFVLSAGAFLWEKKRS